jgi:Fe-S-cluster containining protein
MTRQSDTEFPSKQGDRAYPAIWDIQTLRNNWTEHLKSILKDASVSIPLKRVLYQVERSPVYHEITARWEDMDGDERLKTWKRLLEETAKALEEVLPVCVLCGECCRKGSPTLQLEDLELLKLGKLPWHELFTIRKGQPVRSPFKNEISFLVDERVKVREKAGTQECVFFDDATDQCLVYEDRPAQCRAQACWDPTLAEDLAKQPYLTRRDVFADIELLLDLIEEHDQRCSFSALKNAFERLEPNHAEGLDEILNLLAYEDHFRHFLGEQLKIPQENLDLVFGKSLVDLVPLFGFRIVEEPDGSKCLVPDEQGLPNPPDNS